MTWMWKGASGTITMVVSGLLIAMTVVVVVATSSPSPQVHPYSSSWPLSLYSSSAYSHEAKCCTGMDDETEPLFDLEGRGSIDLDFEKETKKTAHPKYCPSVLATLLYDRKGDNGGIYALPVGIPSPAAHLWQGGKSFSNCDRLGCNKDLWQQYQLEEAANNLVEHENRPPSSPRESLGGIVADPPVSLRVKPSLKEAADNDGGRGCDHPNSQEMTSTSIFDELSRSNRIGERSKASLKTWGELHPRKTGTTLAGVIFDGGVMIGADTRSTSGDVVADKFTEKVHLLAQNMAVCGAGTSADCDKVSQNIRLRLKLVMQQLQEVGEKEVSVFTALKLLCKILFENSNIAAAFLLAGWDASHPHLYQIGPDGSYIMAKFAAQGSGSLAAISSLEKGFRSGMLREEAEQLVRLAILSGIENDLYSGSEVHLCTITKDGATFSKMTSDNNDSFDAGAGLSFRFPNALHHMEERIKGEESGAAAYNLRAAADSDSPKYKNVLQHRSIPFIKVKTTRFRQSLRSIPELRWALHPSTHTNLLSPLGNEEKGGYDHFADPKIVKQQHLSLKIVTSSSGHHLLDNSVERL